MFEEPTFTVINMCAVPLTKAQVLSYILPNAFVNNRKVYYNLQERLVVTQAFPRKNRKTDK